MIHVRSDHEHARLLACALGSLDSHLFQFENIDMIQLLEEFDLSKGGDREAIFLVMHEDLLEGNDLTGLLRPRLRNFAERAFSEFAYIIILLDLGAATKSGLAVVQPFQGLTRGVCFCRHSLSECEAGQRQASVVTIVVRFD